MEKKRLSGKTSRNIRLLRAHGLVRKVPQVNRYVLTEKGQKITAALKCASAVDIEKLMEIAA
jgi:DNA-binding MarR family transcriptional regulator